MTMLMSRLSTLMVVVDDSGCRSGNPEAGPYGLFWSVVCFALFLWVLPHT